MKTLIILIKRSPEKKYLNKCLKYLASVLIILLAFTSCSKKIAGVSSTVVYSRDELKINKINFEYLTIKSKIAFQEAGNEKKANALIRMKKDSIIWFNLSGTMGVQGIRGILTLDSIKTINRVDKEYWALDYDELSREFNFKIDYFLIQAMLLGDMPKEAHENESITKNKDYYIIHQNFGDFYIDNYISASTKKVTEVDILEAPTQNSLKLLYGDFREIEGHVFPYSSFVSLIHNNVFGELETRVNINHTRVYFSDKPMKFPFTVPKKYERK